MARAWQVRDEVLGAKVEVRIRCPHDDAPVWGHADPSYIAVAPVVLSCYEATDGINYS
jgi:hypothetical protein